MNYSELNLRKKLKDESVPYQLLLLADESVDAINKYIHESEVYLIRSGDNTIGVCTIQKRDTSTIEIKNLAVTSTYRNRGVGSWCIKKIEEIYPDKDLLVGTGDASFSALRFYKKNGFKRHAIRKDFFLNTYDHPIIENGIQLKDQIVLKKVQQYQSTSCDR